MAYPQARHVAVAFPLRPSAAITALAHPELVRRNDTTARRTRFGGVHVRFVFAVPCVPAVGNAPVNRTGSLSSRCHVGPRRFLVMGEDYLS